MSLTDYEKAYKAGRREYQRLLSRGESPVLPVLDDILPPKGQYSEILLGTVEIPADQIVGTKTSSRSSAFAANFMPILASNTEFAQKWSNLSTSHVEVGIHTPIKAYEYFNKFYVEEGNKRVSVMKFFGATFIAGDVTRILPTRSRERENRLYYEFLDFYELTRINYLQFSEEGAFLKLQRLVGKKPGEVWSKEEREDFTSVFFRFKSEFEKINTNESATVSDAFLAFLEIHGYENIREMTAMDLWELMGKSREEFNLVGEKEQVELHLDPTDKKPLLGKIHLLGTPTLKIAFIYEKTAESSAWTYGHELGRLHLEQTFPDEVTTCYFDNVTSENIDKTLVKAIGDGCDVIFTTTPAFAQASVKAAIEHPDVRILNCSLNTSHRYIRTYYLRMHEAKFLMGAIAGSMAENDRISYVADYPIAGTIANINAFALGALMVNPRSEIWLTWNCLKDKNVADAIKEAAPSCISARDMLVPNEDSRFFGIYHVEDGMIRNLAMPLMHWGKFYEQLIRAIMDGVWKYDDDDASKAINYWWGMSAGVINVIFSRSLPDGTKRLIKLLKDAIIRGEFQPFTGVLRSQDGVVSEDENHDLSPEEIAQMDWLAENVKGHIPGKDELITSAIPVFMQQGIDGRN